MSVTQASIDRLTDHWAVAAIPPRDRSRAESVSKYRYVHEHVGQQLSLDFTQRPQDDDLVGSLAIAYELAATEGIDALLHPSENPDNIRLADQAQAGAYRAYEFARCLSIPSEDDARVFHILHIAALAYCGDRWSDIRRWFTEHPEWAVSPSVANATWDCRITYRLFECWVRLLRKNRWDDLDGIREVIAGLREDQKIYEAGVLANDSEAATHAMAFRLIALYHWAKATELLAIYMLQGEPAAIETQLDQHFEACRESSQASMDPPFEVLLRWLHVASRKMIAGSIWWVARAVKPRGDQLVDRLTKARGMFELLPPQRSALHEQGLLDPSSTAVVIELPTSGGKTALAQFRILQALNQFDAENGWVAYVAPTRALSAQITRRLRQDFEPLGINVEQLTAAIEIDSFEATLLSASDAKSSFHVLIATPEKLDLLIRNKKVSRPLALMVMDEAQNIEDQERGLRIELLLATIKRDCPNAHFLLMMPHVPNAADLTNWLSPTSGRTISMGTDVWQPNERIVGLFQAQRDSPKDRAWRLTYETLTTTPKTIHLDGLHKVDGEYPLDISFTEAKSLTNQTGAMAAVFSERGTSVAVASTIPNTWSMARTILPTLSALEPLPADIALVQRFLATEISPSFELISMLNKGVAVHHAGLSDETRALVEWLAERGHLRVLCSTTTIAQGINFPVASVFLATLLQPYGREMPKRSFWNLAGRAGRVSQDSVGVVGIAAGKTPDRIRKYVSEATGVLVSRLVSMLDEVEDAGQLNNLALVIEQEQWNDFRSYVAHLWAEKQKLDEVLASTEQLLRNTFGYQTLQSTGTSSQKRKAKALLDATKVYARKISNNPGGALLSDSTGFAPEGVLSALAGMGSLTRRLTPSDWQPRSLFGPQGQSMLPQLVGVMMRIPDIRRSLEEIGGSGFDQRRIAQVAQSWVSGAGIARIAELYFSGTPEKPVEPTDAITDACKAIYRSLTNAATWGLSALSKLGPSGLDFKTMTPEMQRVVNSLPAMLYHGVSTEPAVVMRMNAVPRTVAERMGAEFASSVNSEEARNVRVARKFLRELSSDDWQKFVPRKAPMSGADYRNVWATLSGESL